MPVPSSMADLSTLSSSNFPTGTEAIGNSLDNYLRAHASIIRSTNAISAASIAAASTTNIGLSDGEVVVVNGSATINNFGTGFAGCRREVRFSASCTIVASSSIALPGGLNVTTTSGMSLTFRCLSTGVWTLSGGSVDPGALRTSGGTMTGGITFDVSGTLSRVVPTTTDLFVEPPVGRSVIVRGYAGGGGAKFSVDGSSSAFSFESPSAAWVAGTFSAGDMYLRPNGVGSVVGEVRLNSAGVLLASNDIITAGNLVSNSDERLKTGWQDVPSDMVERMAKVKRGTYVRTDTGAEQVGVGAQSIAAVMPLAVHEGDDGKLSVAYGNAALVLSCELAERVVSLESRIKEMEG